MVAVNEEAWTALYERAACADSDVDFFDMEVWRDAVRVCWTCPVSAECNEMANRYQERFGVWGGVPRHGTPRTRRKYLMIMESVWKVRATKGSEADASAAAEQMMNGFRGKRTGDRRFVVEQP